MGTLLERFSFLLKSSENLNSIVNVNYYYFLYFTRFRDWIPKKQYIPTGFKKLIKVDHSRFDRCEFTLFVIIPDILFLVAEVSDGSVIRARNRQWSGPPWGGGVRETQFHAGCSLTVHCLVLELLNLPDGLIQTQRVRPDSRSFNPVVLLIRRINLICCIRILNNFEHWRKIWLNRILLLRECFSNCFFKTPLVILLNKMCKG